MSIGASVHNIKMEQQALVEPEPDDYSAPDIAFFPGYLHLTIGAPIKLKSKFNRNEEDQKPNTTTTTCRISHPGITAIEKLKLYNSHYYRAQIALYSSKLVKYSREYYAAEAEMLLAKEKKLLSRAAYFSRKAREFERRAADADITRAEKDRFEKREIGYEIMADKLRQQREAGQGGGSYLCG